MKNNSLTEISNFILDQDKFLLTSHVGPDGDNIGSVIALKLALEQLGKEVEVVIGDSIPDCFSFLPTIDQIQEYDSDLKLKFDAVCVLDCGSWDRVGEVEEIVSDEIIVNIDHHGDNTYFGDYNLAKDAAATAEIIYQLIQELKVKLNHDLATALATALLTDTGSFRYSNTTAMTHQIMAELLDYDIDTSYIARQVFGTNSYQNLKLRGQVLQNLKTDNSGQIAWLKISQALLDKVGATLDDTEGLVGYPRSLEGVEVGVLFKEDTSKGIKVSLRSNSYLPVNEVAHQFDGGGHPRAAGCLIEDSLEQAEEKVVSALKEALAQYSTEYSRF
ncbi:bifunctional oligoribonuclease/PAP phosphatase NrnA [Halanaerocella petrolearia]